MLDQGGSVGVRGGGVFERRPREESSASTSRWGALSWLVGLLPPFFALAAEMLLWSFIRPFGFLLFYPAVFVSSWLGGFPAGAAATLVSLASVSFVLAPRLAGTSTEHARVLSDVTFAVMGLLVSFLHERLRLSQRQVAVALRNATTNLGESEERLALLMQHAPAALAMFDRDMRYLIASQRWLDDYKVVATEALGRSHDEVFPDTPERWKAIHRRALAGEVVSASADCFVRADGSVQWLKWEARPWRRADGAVGGIVVFSEDITSSVTARDAQLESEERFRRVVEAAPEAIFIQTGGNFAYINPAAIRLFGADGAANLLGTPVLERIAPDVRALAAERMARVNERRESPGRRDFGVVRFDGQAAVAEFSAAPISYRGQNGALVFARDVTEARAQEEKARFHEAVMRETGEIAKVGGWSFDPATGAGYWSDEVARIHDLPPDASTDMRVGLGFYQGDARARIERAVKRAIEQGEPYDLELELVSAKGVTKWVRTIGHPVLENDKVVRVRGSFQDITERKLAEDALRESDARFRLLVENIQEMFWIADPVAEKLLYVSPGYQRIWGPSPASLEELRARWAESIHPEDRARVLAHRQRQPRELGYEDTYRIMKDNKVRWVHVQTFPVHERGREGKEPVLRIVGTANDVTERTLLEQQFRQAQKMEAIGTLAGGIAHDFNNILCAIGGYAQLAREDLNAPDLGDSLDEIMRATERAASLVRQILTFSRHQEQKRVPVDVSTVVQEAGKLLRALLPSTIEITQKVSRNVPAVLADATHVHQVMMNLCTNAAHAMEGRPGRLTVAVDRFEGDEEFAAMHDGARACSYVKLSVTDTGHGMDRATLDRIFEPFFTTKVPGKGTGLGLSVVHGIVKSYGGLITVYSRVDAGTTFHVYLPALAEGGAEAPASKPDIPRGAGQRIFVVDDEAPLAQMIGKMLERLGYQAVVSTSPAALLRAMRGPGPGPDLVITDLTMPEMTGVELARTLSTEWPGLPVVLTTGYSGDQSAGDLANAGIRDVLLKPLTSRALGEALARLLAGV